MLKYISLFIIPDIITITVNVHKRASLLLSKYIAVLVDDEEYSVCHQREEETVDFFPVKRRFSLNQFKFHGSAVFLFTPFMTLPLYSR